MFSRFVQKTGTQPPDNQKGSELIARVLHAKHLIKTTEQLHVHGTVHLDISIVKPTRCTIFRVY